MRIFLLLVLGISMASADVYNDKQIFHELVFEIRDPQTAPARFRKCLQKIGEYLALEVLEELNTTQTTVNTLTNATAAHPLCSEKSVLVTILRAGLPLVYGVQKVFSNSEVGFLAMSRNEETLQPLTSYIALPDIEGKTVILADTMLATGGSFLDAIKIVEQYSPKQIIVLCAIASEEGIARIENYNSGIKIFAAATDPLLNEKGYIVPGLGDAGDRSYGLKH